MTRAPRTWQFARVYCPSGSRRVLDVMHESMPLDLRIRTYADGEGRAVMTLRTAINLCQRWNINGRCTWHYRILLTEEPK